MKLIQIILTNLKEDRRNIRFMNYFNKKQLNKIKKFEEQIS